MSPPRTLSNRQEADLLQNDAGINQGAFASAIWPDMDAFVKSSLFGKMTMMLLYAYRTPEDTLVRGHASVHSVKEAPYFDESADWDSKVWAPWKQYAEEVLPQRVRTDAPKLTIPLDEDGTPIFPELDVMATAPAIVVGLTREFVEKLWAHCRPSATFEWNVVGAHYDQKRFALPVALESLESTSDFIDAIRLAQFFLSLEGENCFVFEAECNKDGDEEMSGEEEPDKNDNGGGKKGKGKGKGKQKQESTTNGNPVSGGNGLPKNSNPALPPVDEGGDGAPNNGNPAPPPADEGGNGAPKNGNRAPPGTKKGKAKSKVIHIPLVLFLD
ncbi:hypothetical protein FB451DRAFT_777722 [Mycena latifolia]|nr:hypothetical protein FB451DRAFT_777722 [Mycena latifolia]